METLQRIIEETTDAFVATLNKGDDDFLQIEEDLMRKMKIRIGQVNQAMTKGETRLSMPKHLSNNQIAKILNAVKTIKVVTDRDNDDTRILAIYNGEIYETDTEQLDRIALKLNEALTQKDLQEINNRLYLYCEKQSINKDRNLIAVGNGIFNYETKALMPFSEDHVFLSKSIVNYNPNAKLKTFADGWNIENWIDDIAIDSDVSNLLWEVMSAILRPYVKWNKSVWLYSTSGNNGKGTFCELLRNLLGPKAHTSIPLSDFGKEFTLGPLIGKQAVIVDENDVGTYIDKAGTLKAIITGDIISINQKYKQPINYRFQGMMIQCLNEYPKVKDKSDSFYRRQIFIPFNKCFTGHENKNIKAQYLKDPDVLEYIMYKVLQTDFYELSEPASCKNALESYKEANDPVRQFWSEFESQFAWDLLPYKFLYELYKAWYEQNYPRGQVVAKPSFEDALRTMIIRESQIWTCDPDPKKRIRSGSRMTQPEPLIIEYQLKNWYSKTYQGVDAMKKCKLTNADLADNYTGVLRK